jgi:hypothetical protein
VTAHVEHGHIADRPSWDCLACVKSWPCDPAREALATQMDPVQLAMYLWSNLEEAAGDLPDMPVGEAFDRFISWTRSPNRASAP